MTITEANTIWLSDLEGRDLQPDSYTDSGNADLLVKAYERKLLHTDSLGWFAWGGNVWMQNDHMAILYADNLFRKMLGEAKRQHAEALQKVAELSAADSPDKEALEKAKAAAESCKAFRTHALHSCNRNRMVAAVELLRAKLTYDASGLDALPYILNTPGGIVDLRDGKIYRHDAALYCTKITDTAPGEDGREEWEQFLQTITCGDVEMADYLQQVVGMALFGTVYEEGIILAVGNGRNGKSTFFNALSHVLDDYAGSISSATLTNDRNNKGSAKATMRGKRVIITGELEERHSLSISTLKEIASTDKMIIEAKYKDPEEVEPSHSIFLFTNHLPRVSQTDNGTWRRMTVLPFKANIPEGEGVPNYAKVLAARCGGAILSWMIEGAVKFWQNGCKVHVPASIRKATDEYRAREDWLAQYLDERCVRDPKARITNKQLYEDYKHWADTYGEYRRRTNDFAAAMEEKGFRKHFNRNKTVVWFGLRFSEYNDNNDTAIAPETPSEGERTALI